MSSPGETIAEALIETKKKAKTYRNTEKRLTGALNTPHSGLKELLASSETVTWQSSSKYLHILFCVRF